MDLRLFHDYLQRTLIGQLRIPYNTFPLTKALIVETFGKNKNIFVSPIASFVNYCYNNGFFARRVSSTTCQPEWGVCKPKFNRLHLPQHLSQMQARETDDDNAKQPKKKKKKIEDSSNCSQPLACAQASYPVFKQAEDRRALHKARGTIASCPRSYALIFHCTIARLAAAHIVGTAEALPILCVRCARWERQIQREREKERESVRRTWRHLSSAEIGDEFCTFPCENVHVSISKDLEFCTVPWQKFVPLSRTPLLNSAEFTLPLHVNTLHSSKQFAFFVASVKWRDRGSKHRNKRSNFRLHRPSSHWKSEWN